MTVLHVVLLVLSRVGKT